MQVRGVFKFVLMVVVVELLSSSVHGQLKDIIPPSPTAQQFDKFINYDVSLFNGIPEISVPIYTINVGGIQIPIQLNYHASGIKYGQNSGEVGIGWALSSGHRVSRTIRGRPDDHYEKPTISIPNNGNMATKDKYLASFANSNELDIPFPDNFYDGEYDLFTYSTLKNSGNFVISDRQNKQVKILDYEDMNMSYNTDYGQKIDFFDVRDGDGIKYRFGKDINTGVGVHEQIDGLDAYSSWDITNITDPLGNAVNFSYQQYQELDWVHGDNSYSITQGGVLNEFEYTASSAIAREGEQSDINNYNVQRVSAITSANETIVFVRDQSGVLQNILVKNKDNVIIKTVSFFYSTPNRNTFLDSVRIVGENSSAKQVYKFDYYDKTVDLPLWGGVKDYWGYYKRTTNYGNIPYYGTLNYTDILKRDPGSDGLLFHYNNVPITPDQMRQVDRNPESGPPQVYSLKQITYPTGGSTEFIYESNKYQGLRDDNLTFADKWVGLRIKQIVSRNLGSEALVKNYMYGENESGYGIVGADIADKRYFALSTGNLYRIDDIDLNTRLAITNTYSSNIMSELGLISSIGSPIHYKEVAVYESNSSFVSDGSNGKTVFKYSLPDQIFTYHGMTNETYTAFETSQLGSPSLTLQTRQYPNYFIGELNMWNDKPTLLEKVDYKMVNTSFAPVLKESYMYDYVGAEALEELKVKVFMRVTMPAGYQTFWGCYSSDNNSFFDYQVGYLSRGRKLLSQKSTVNYSDAGTLTSASKYYYNSVYNLSREETTTSKGENLISHHAYPTDFVGLSATDDNTLGVKKLKDLHVDNQVVESYTERVSTDLSKKRLVNAQYFTFYPDKPLLRSVSSVDLDGPMADFNNAIVTNGAVVNDVRYKERFSFLNYDNKGNLLEQQKKGDISEVFLWGYGSQYPVAKISNTTYDIAKTYVTQSVLDSQIDDVTLRAHLNNLRNIPGAIVTTLTYKPSIGKTSETDPVGRTIYYEYDGMGRLKLIRDQDNNTIKTFCYNFAGQPGDCDIKVFTSVQSLSFSKNDCAGGTGSTVSYSATATSGISQEDADAKALADVKAKGQNNANANGFCTFTSTKSNTYITNCNSCSTGSSVPYSATATSTISQLDADAKAQAALDANGQNNADQYGTCVLINNPASLNASSQTSLTWFSLSTSNNVLTVSLKFSPAINITPGAPFQVGTLTNTCYNSFTGCALVYSDGIPLQLIFDRGRVWVQATNQTLNANTTISITNVTVPEGGTCSGGR